MKAEDLFPGDIVKARAPGTLFPSPRRIVDIDRVYGGGDWLKITFDDGLEVIAYNDQELSEEEVLHLARVYR